MKVILVVSSYAPNVGGLQSVTLQLARELKKRGHGVFVLTNKYPRSLSARETLDDVPVIRWQFLTPLLRFLLNLRVDLFVAGFVYLPLTLLRLLLFLKRERPDVVNLQFVGAPGLFVLLAHWLKPFRLVISLHGDDVEGLARGGWFDRWVFRSLLRRANVVTACSRYLLTEAIAFEPSARQKGRPVYNGMEPLVESSRSIARGGLVAAGRMFPKKGFDVLLQAQANSQSRPHLTLIGDGPERDNLEQLARSLGLNGEIRFRGQLDHAGVLEQMRAAELVVVPSRQEPFGMVALEAMAMGKPVIASRVGGLPEVLEGADGLLVEPDNPRELSEAIETMQARVRDTPGFGARNRKLAAQFSTDRMTDGYLEAYQA
ncbi:MAG TPA: glycosyltransferase family 4 protein [Pyrinomonadaceae bacterium]|nr:glycosyltransferase family 4 protein [Pyrinomonadaceae bacterium]